VLTDREARDVDVVGRLNTPVGPVGEQSRSGERQPHAINRASGRIASSCERAEEHTASQERDHSVQEEALSPCGGGDI